jgi:transposase
MKSWLEIAYFAGFDWARDHHDVVIVDRQGKIVEQFRFEHSQEGWEQWRKKTASFAPLAVAIETSFGAAVDQLLRGEAAVYPVNPKSAQRYRDRKVPSGSKTDFLDAWSLADALRIDGHGWKALAPTDELTSQLQMLCRDEVQLIGQRTLFINQLQQALLEYYPAALEAFDDWTMAATWDFIIEFPTPRALVKAGKRRWEKFLHVHRLWRPETAEKRMGIFARADQFCGSAALTAAKSVLAVSLAKMLRALQQQLDVYREQIAALFAKHPDHDLFGSLPGAGSFLAPRLLGEIGGGSGRFESAQHLQGIAGTAPVSYQSGQIDKVRIRHHCDKFLRHAVHLWSDCSRKACQWAQVYYQKKREEGKSHACALRCLGQRWLKIIWKMLQTHAVYNPELHAKNQQLHGSWVLSLVTKTSR